jgi:hypothetical protein
MFPEKEGGLAQSGVNVKKYLRKGKRQSAGIYGIVAGFQVDGKDFSSCTYSGGIRKARRQTR